MVLLRCKLTGDFCRAIKGATVIFDVSSNDADAATVSCTRTIVRSGACFSILASKPLADGGERGSTVGCGISGMKIEDIRVIGPCPSCRKPTSSSAGNGESGSTVGCGISGMNIEVVRAIGPRPSRSTRTLPAHEAEETERTTRNLLLGFIPKHSFAQHPPPHALL